MSEEDEIELIDILIANPNRIENRETKITPPVGIKSMVLSYNYKFDVYNLRFGRTESNGAYNFTQYYDLVEVADTYLAYKVEMTASENTTFFHTPENKVLKIVFAFTGDLLNKLADAARLKITKTT